MKKNNFKILFFLAGILLMLSSCRDDLLNQPSRTELTSELFWETADDAEYALNGAVADIRYLFSRDYYLDAKGEFVNVSGCNLQGSSGNTSNPFKAGGAYDGFFELNPAGYGYSFTNMYRFCYGGVNRCNYVIDGIERMLENETKAETVKRLEEFIAEAKLFRALIYLRLISMWGDVPYIDQRIYYKEEVESISRTPIEEIKDHMLEDLTYAAEKLPDQAARVGRMAKPAALALRGKVQLYWASWNKFGWPELDTFTPSEQKAMEAYKAAAADFKKVIDDFGLTLYRNGEPGTYTGLGNAEELPNYYYLFTPVANGDPEIIMAFTHGTTGSEQSEELMRDLAGRSIEYSQCWVNPRFALADRYQSVTTGDFCDKLIPMSPNTQGARTAPNSAINPDSYANRDYRMKATFMWDYEMCMGLYARKETGWIPFIYKTENEPVEIDGVTYTTYNTENTCKTGYVFRKFVRNYPGQERSEGDYNWPVIRLADVYLMFAEAVHFGGIAEEKAYAIELVNRVRHRGNLPPLTADKTSDAAGFSGNSENLKYSPFFLAIEQERIVELVAEGHRPYDLRRWRRIGDAFAPPFDPDGYVVRDTWGNATSGYSHNGVFFQNQPNLAYERCYIYSIPQGERDKNPNLTQNKPFL
ncbi:MAG: RagB/SusD family nutrient uptake outer membrane protein [Candidatus Azobacteroides sp.]|nr:RagB/SusD family nutrient uptake outer membrane protein [Candidatus Azobacteroides sp.]